MMLIEALLLQRRAASQKPLTIAWGFLDHGTFVLDTQAAPMVREVPIASGCPGQVSAEACPLNATRLAVTVSQLRRRDTRIAIPIRTNFAEIAKLGVGR